MAQGEDKQHVSIELFTFLSCRWVNMVTDEHGAVEIAYGPHGHPPIVVSGDDAVDAVQQLNLKLREMGR